MKASLKNASHAPRKIRLIANLIKGKKVSDALATLSVTPKRAAGPIAKLLNSALANAKNTGVSLENLIVKECRVDGGATMKRFMPGARGSAFPIHKHMSHVNLLLEAKIPKVKALPKKADIVTPKK